MFSEQAEFHAQNPTEMNRRLTNALHGIIAGWYKGEEVVFDKSRGWLQYYELLSSFWPNPKIIVPIRDIRDAIASFERLWRNHPYYHHPADNPAANPDFQFVDGRVRHWFTTGSPIGLSLARIYDAIARQNANKMLFIRYEDLATDPIAQLKRIYEFIHEPWYKKHNPQKVPQVTHEDDSFFGPLGDHRIKNKVEPNPKTWTDVLPQHCGKLITDTFQWFYTTFYPNQ